MVAAEPFFLPGKRKEELWPYSDFVDNSILPICETVIGPWT